MGEAFDRLDAANVFGVFVADLAFDPETQRRAVGHAQRPAVHGPGQDRLRMAGVDQVDALIIALAVLALIQGVETVKDDVSGLGLQPRLVQQGGVTIDDVKVASIDESLARERFEGEGVIVRKGKKVYHRVKV